VILLIQKYNFGASREDSYYLLLAVAAVLVVAGGLLFSTSGPTGLLTGIPPSVSITSPPNGIKINDSVTVSASAFGGVSKVRFLDVEDNVYADDSTSPFSATWSQISQGRPSEKSTRTLKALSLDSNNNQVASAQITVTHQNNPDPPANVAMQSGNSVANLSWTAPVYTGNAISIICYKVFRSTSANPSSNNANLISSTDATICKDTDPTGTTYNDATVSNGATYFYSIKSVALNRCTGMLCSTTPIFSDGSSDAQASPSSTTTTSSPTASAPSSSTTTSQSSTTTLPPTTTTTTITQTSGQDIQAATTTLPPPTPTTWAVTEAEAFAAIESANKTIISVAGQKDVTNAMKLYSSAVESYNTADYAAAKNLALQSVSAIKDIKKEESPILFVSIGAILIIVVLVGIIYYMKTRKPPQTAVQTQPPAPQPSATPSA